MAAGCGAKLSKFLLIAFNICFFFFGGVVLGIGIWIVTDQGSLMKLIRAGLGSSVDNAEQYLSTPSLVEAGSYVLIAIGAVTFLVGFCGCCGAIKENNCLLGLYAFFIFLVLGAEIAGAVLAGIYKEKMETTLFTQLQKIFSKFYIGLPVPFSNAKPISLLFDLTMIKFECCGITGKTDFDNETLTAAWHANKTDAEKVPASCCKFYNTTFVDKGDYDNIRSYMMDETCITNPTGNNTNMGGCYKAVLVKTKTYSTVLIAVAACIAALEFLGIICACCLMRAVKDNGK